MRTLGACNHRFQFFYHSQGSFLQQYKQHLPAARTAHQRTGCPKQGMPEAIRMTPDYVKTVSFLPVSFPPLPCCSSCMRDTHLTPLWCLGQRQTDSCYSVQLLPVSSLALAKKSSRAPLLPTCPARCRSSSRAHALQFQELWRAEISSAGAKHSQIMPEKLP